MIRNNLQMGRFPSNFYDFSQQILKEFKCLLYE